MTTAADDSAVEDAFEALLAGRPAPHGAAGLAAFTEAVRTIRRPRRAGPTPRSPNCWPPVFSSTSRARPPGRPDRPGPRRRARPGTGFGDVSPCSSPHSSPSSSPPAPSLRRRPAPPSWSSPSPAPARWRPPGPVQDTVATAIETVTPLDLEGGDQTVTACGRDRCRRRERCPPRRPPPPPRRSRPRARRPRGGSTSSCGRPAPSTVSPSGHGSARPPPRSRPCCARPR